MKVQGSAFYFGKEVDAAAGKFPLFFKWIEGLPQGSTWPPHKPFLKGQAFRRELFTNTTRDMYCGVILSARATDFNHYINRQGNKVRVETRNVGPNPPVEVNFFCLRRDSGKGLYSHYYGSFAFGNFLASLWGAYRKFIELECLQAVAAAIDDEDQIRRLFSLRGRGMYAPLYNPHDFERLIRELQEVYEVRLTTYSVDAPDDAPLSQRISNVHKVYRLHDAQRVDQQLLGWLRGKRGSATRQLKSSRQSTSGSVSGVDGSGRERTVFFDSTLDDLLNFDYDSIGSFDVTNLAANPCLAAMITTVHNGVMFR